MIGEPRAKRHVFAKRLSKLLQILHISWPRSSAKSSILAPPCFQIANALDAGKLAPEKIIFGLL
ncbi:hypothetical protein AAHE18_02G104600 [Arachis hypogaea]